LWFQKTEDFDQDWRSRVWTFDSEKETNGDEYGKDDGWMDYRGRIIGRIVKIG
jgi:hypothetical protein